MTTLTIHMDSDGMSIKRTRGMKNPTVALYDGRGGYLTLFLTERSVGMLATVLEECRQSDITEFEVGNVAQDSRR